MTSANFTQRCVIMGLILLAAAGCGQKKESASAPAPAAVSAAPPVRDVGKLASVRTTASGLGASAGEAMSEAMKMALLQVNGAVMQSQSVSAKYGLDASLGKDSASLRANEFIELVKQKSGGVIQNLKVLALEEPGAQQPARYKATIEADIAKFTPSADLQKIKLVIGPVVFEQASLPMGDAQVPSAQVATTLRQRVNDALVQTGRFAVLDRDLSPEIARELDMIASGQAPSAELAKLSQAASADLVWSARVSAFAYHRHARALRTSDRELVSYSGGWALSQKLVNVATRQVLAAESLRGTAPDREPTTLGTGVDGGKVMADMEEEAAKAIVGSILERMFPLTVVARDGTNVVLSQGGRAVREGARYQVVAMGGELKDPQTGQSLGRTESPCCELVIDRVTPNLSYGHLENARVNLDTAPPGGLQVRKELPALKVAAAPSAQAGSAAAAAPGSARSSSVTPGSGRPPPAAKPAPEPGTLPAPGKDAKW